MISLLPEMNPALSLGLPRAKRITQGSDFTRLKRSGRRLSGSELILNWSPQPAGPSRLGLITSRRLGNAVIRNRTRRHLRECFRIHQHELTHPIELVIVALPPLAAMSFREVEAALLRALTRASLLAKP